jgi:hypothetical protein
VFPVVGVRAPEARGAVVIDFYHFVEAITFMGLLAFIVHVVTRA